MTLRDVEKMASLPIRHCIPDSTLSEASLLPGQFDEISSAIGALRAELRILARVVERNQEASIDEHRKVHDIVVAASEAMRNLAREVAEIKPLTDDYREKRAEKRGANRLVHTVYMMGSGLAGAILARMFDLIQTKPHP